MCACALERREQAKRDACENSDAQSKHQYPLIDGKIVEERSKRNALNRIKGGKDRKKPAGKKETSYPAEQRQENVLR